MKFNLGEWFSLLEQSIFNLLENDNVSAYEVTVGLISFNVIVPTESFYTNAINSFYAVKPIKEINKHLFTVFCLDNHFIDLLPAFNISKNDLNQIEFDNRLSKSKQLINYDQQRQILKIFNMDSQFGLLYCNDFNAIPDWEIYSPLKDFIHLLALQNNCWLAHAGSLSIDNKGILLVGPGGNGKSTTTAIGLKREFNTVGDDYILIDCSINTLKAYPIYRTIKLHSSKIIEMPCIFESFQHRIIPATGKNVFICNALDENGPFVKSFDIKFIFGLFLNKTATNNHNGYKKLELHYYSASSIEQIPLWIDKSSHIAKRILALIPSELIEFPPGPASINETLDYAYNKITCC